MRSNRGCGPQPCARSVEGTCWKRPGVITGGMARLEGLASEAKVEW